MRGHKPILVGAAVLGVLFKWSAASGCSCGQSSVEEAFKSSGAVVEGRVVDEASGYPRVMWCEFIDWLNTKTGRHEQCGVVKLTLAISNRWKGPSDDMIDVLTGRGGGDCGLPLRVGDSYVLYLFKPEGGSDWETNICMRPTPSDRAGEERLALTVLAHKESK